MKIGEKIKKLRGKQKAYEFAHDIGITPPYLSEIETKGKIPSLEVMRRIALYFDDIFLLEDYIAEKYPEVLKIQKEIVKHIEIWDNEADNHRKSLKE
ncbi:MAG: helix-turn-helix transcriptional regulator [Candidatus Omnitrophica bacterium]|nr:helix-turn-helix transcriptional regulator [Candidatus Omnitrophota bacterium]